MQTHTPGDKYGCPVPDRLPSCDPIVRRCSPSHAWAVTEDNFNPLNKKLPKGGGIPADLLAPNSLLATYRFELKHRPNSTPLYAGVLYVPNNDGRHQHAVQKALNSIRRELLKLLPFTHACDISSPTLDAAKGSDKEIPE